MNESHFQTEFISMIEKHREELISEWQSELLSNPEFSSGIIRPHIPTLLNELFDHLMLSTVGQPVFSFKPLQFPHPSERSHLELRFIFAAEGALMKVMYGLFDFGVNDWMKIRSMLNHAFHQILRYRLDHHCSSCRSVLDEDIQLTHRIEDHIQSHLKEQNC
jgi:hypothetical protein